MAIQNEKLLTQFKFKLQELNQDTSFLDDNKFDFFQKFAMYRSVRLGLNLYGINDPNMDADEMDDIVTTQEVDLKTFREKLDIDPREYNFAQIRELVDASQTGLDVTPYLNPLYSADHMHIAKTFQQEGLPGIEQVHPDKSITELISFRKQTRQLMQKSKQFLQSDSELINSVIEEREEKREYEKWLPHQQDSEYKFESLAEEETQALATSKGVDQPKIFENVKVSNMDFQSAREELSQILDNPLAADVVSLDESLKEYPDLVNTKLNNGNFPLMISSYWNKTMEVIIELKHGADVNLSSEIGDTALIEAARSNSFEISKILIEYGAKVNHTNHEGTSALSIAARNGNLELSQLLVEHRAMVNSQDIHGNTPLHYVSPNNSELTKYLIEHGASALEQNMSAISKLQEIGGNKYEKITDSKPDGLTLSQIVSLSQGALASSYLHLEESKTALAEALAFENIDSSLYNKFEAESYYHLQQSKTALTEAPDFKSLEIDLFNKFEAENTNQTNEPISIKVSEKTKTSEEDHGFNHS